MPICPNCGSSLPCTCACSAGTIRIIYDDVDEREIERDMGNAAIAEKQNRPGTAIRYYRNIIEEIGDDKEYESIKKEAEQAIKNINRAENFRKEAETLYDQYKYEDALTLINSALSYSQNNCEYWNIKALILENLKRFEESEECYDKAVKLHASKTIKNNEATMLSNRAYELDKNGNYVLANIKISKALTLFGSDEEYEKGLKCKINILGNYNTYLREIKFLERYDETRDELIGLMGQIVLEDETIKEKISQNQIDEKNIDEILSIYAKKGYEYLKKNNSREYAFALYIKANICEKEKKYLKAMLYYANSYHINYWYSKPLKDFENLLKNVEVETLQKEMICLKNINENRSDEAEMIYQLAFAIESSKIPEKIPLAIGLANIGIELLSKPDHNKLLSKTDHEKINKFHELINSTKNLIKFYREYGRTIEYIKSTNKENLITITGNQYQAPDFEFKKGMILRLIREPENQYDHEAIAVYYNEKKVGYIANSNHTASDATTMAHDLHNIGKNAHAEYLMMYEGYHYAKITNDMEI